MNVSSPALFPVSVSQTPTHLCLLILAGPGLGRGQSATLTRQGSRRWPPWRFLQQIWGLVLGGKVPSRTLCSAPLHPGLRSAESVGVGAGVSERGRCCHCETTQQPPPAPAGERASHGRDLQRVVLLPVKENEKKQERKHCIVREMILPIV